MKAFKQILCCSSPKTSKEESIGMPCSERNLLQSQRTQQANNIEKHVSPQQDKTNQQQDSKQIQKLDSTEIEEIQLPSPSKTNKQNQDYLQNLEKTSFFNQEEDLNIPEENSDHSDEEIIQTALKEEFNTIFQEHFLSLSSQEAKKEIDSLVYSTEQQSFKKNHIYSSLESPKEEQIPNKPHCLTQDIFSDKFYEFKEKQKSSTFHFTPTYFSKSPGKSSFKNLRDAKKYI